MMPTGYRPKVDFKVPTPPPRDPSGIGASSFNLRDHFAGLAMQIMWDAYDKGYCGLNDNDEPNVTTIAKGAYSLADAMLEARK